MTEKIKLIPESSRNKYTAIYYIKMRYKLLFIGYVLLMSFIWFYTGLSGYFSTNIGFILWIAFIIIPIVIVTIALPEHSIKHPDSTKENLIYSYIYDGDFVDFLNNKKKYCPFCKKQIELSNYEQLVVGDIICNNCNHKFDFHGLNLHNLCPPEYEEIIKWFKEGTEFYKDLSIPYNYLLKYVNIIKKNINVKIVIDEIIPNWKPTDNIEDKSKFIKNTSSWFEKEMGDIDFNIDKSKYILLNSKKVEVGYILRIGGLISLSYLVGWDCNIDSIKYAKMKTNGSNREIKNHFWNNWENPNYYDVLPFDELVDKCLFNEYQDNIIELMYSDSEVYKFSATDSKRYNPDDFPYQTHTHSKFYNEKDDSKYDFENKKRETQREQNKHSDLESEMAKILELKRNFNWRIIRIQYRKLMMQYHPDRVSHLGKEIKDLSKKKTIEILEAYDYFKRKYSK